MNAPTQVFLTALETAAIAANEAEGALRKRMTEEIARLERERAFAYRRLNLISEVARTVASAENGENAIACGTAIVRVELGWESDSESRTETLARFAPVIRAAFEGLNPSEQKEPTCDIVGALADFEAWYESTYDRPFWVLFDQYIPELPLVER